MKILVIGGTGTVGSEVVNELLKQDAEVTVLTRKNIQEADLPKGVNHLRGDLMSPDTVRSMCRGMDAMFLLNAVSSTEAHQGIMAVNGAKISDIHKIVYMSVQHADQAPHLPHFGAKLPVEKSIKKSGIPYVILRPNSFFQNDLMLKNSMLEFGIYTNPLGEIGLSRVDVRDIAEAVAITLTDDTYKHETITVAGPEITTGESSAEIWSNVLNKNITYGGNDLDAWEKQAIEFIPDWMAFDLRLMYEFFQTEGLLASDQDIRRLTDLLGHPPRKLEDFAQKTAEMWKKKQTIKNNAAE